VQVALEEVMPHRAALTVACGAGAVSLRPT
jgi:hypothetical protein